MNIIEQLNAYVDEYKIFMGIDKFPEYNLQTRTASIITAETQGFESVASTLYQPITGQHTLIISSNLNLLRYVMFHEFTHMYDSELYVNGDKVRYLGLSGYTEYHASQIELAQLLGAKCFNDIPSFSMNTMISAISKETSVLQYVENKYNHAINLFNRSDFPADLSILKSALGVLYNYWGLRSICEMYSTDFVEKIDNAAFLKFIPSMNFSLINNIMHGWLDKTKIDLSIPLYANAIMAIIKDYNLN